MTVNGVKAKHFTSLALRQANEILIKLDICREELDLEKALAIQRDKYNRLIAHIYIDGLHLNHELIRLGFSPYFNKYGNSRLYDVRLREAQAIARSQKLTIWSEAFQGEYFRDYDYLLPWWNRRAAVVDLARFSSVNSSESSVNGSKKVWDCGSECCLITRFGPMSESIHALVDFQNPLQLFKKGSALKVRVGQDLLRVFFPTDVLRENFNLIDQLRVRKDYAILEGFIEQYRGIPQLRVTQIRAGATDN